MKQGAKQGRTLSKQGKGAYLTGIESMPLLIRANARMN